MRSRPRKLVVILILGTFPLRRARIARIRAAASLLLFNEEDRLLLVLGHLYLLSLGVVWWPGILAVENRSSID